MKTYRCLLTTTLFLLFAVAALATPHYVDANGRNATPPYLDWSTAATNIQDAVDAAVAGDEVVVTNGIYANGGRAAGTNIIVNRVAVDKLVTVRSVNGPALTIIQGYQVPWTNGDGAIRCVYLTNGASLIGFTLTKGATRLVYSDPTFAESNGGGVWCDAWGVNEVIISNCVVSGNSANGSGGGAYRGTLYNCRLEGNVANAHFGYGGGGALWAVLYNCTLAGNRSDVGGGAHSCSLYNCIVINNSASNFGGGGSACGFVNCTVTGNSAVTGGGGAAESFLVNSIVYYNSATSGEPNSDSSSANNSCTTEFRDYQSANNITNPPLFAADLHLRSDSPCINSGDNAFVGGPTDFGGNPRIAGGTVDMGAYEFQTPASAISYAWLQQYRLPINGSTDHSDSDGDGMNNWQEWRADTIPTNALSALRMATVTNSTPGLQVTWQSVSTRNYRLERSTDLGTPPSFSSIASNLAGQVGTTTYADTNAIGAGPFFYRVGVQP